ncbi:(2Fe-2S)-binding protein [Oceanobacillus timonensis]|uniref:(2Fe-2S)-binding protein n=1 Tax=Oceanobacillus timonensis TaxID=1926285 RepID=UPI0009BBABC7|nr:(2Fe-2S)-binding protein [Oceanobacillus timonensis]
MSVPYRLNETNQEKEKVAFYFNNKELYGYENEPIASALMANGIRTVRVDEKTGEPRGVYCGIGHCFECRAEVDGISNVRTCLTPLKKGTNVNTVSDVSGEGSKS